MKWIDVSTDNDPAELLVSSKKSILARVWEAKPEEGGGWWGGTYNGGGRLTPLIPKPYASRALAKQMVEEAVNNQKDLRG